MQRKCSPKIPDYRSRFCFFRYFLKINRGSLLLIGSDGASINASTGLKLTHYPSDSFLLTLTVMGFNNERNSTYGSFAVVLLSDGDDFPPL